jgi:Ca2+-binding RTX toxin-like protein
MAEEIFAWEGISLPSYWGGNFATPSGQQALDAITAAGANTVTLIPNFFMESTFSNTMRLNLNPIDPANSESDTFAQVQAAIQSAVTKGLRVVLKPHVETNDRVWRAEIAPADPDLWFKNYKAMIVEYAKVAQTSGAAMFVIGTEMKSMTVPRYTDRWVDIINTVRSVYGGSVTYSATVPESAQVQFWDKLDAIGINAYFPMTTSSKPSVTQLIDAWIKPSAIGYTNTIHKGLSAVDYYKSIATQWGKPVIFTEVGYQSIDGTTRDPGVYDPSGPPDHQEQRDAYEALFHVVQNYGGAWLDGMFLWSYQTVKDENWVSDYTTQDKPANGIVTAGYSSPSHWAGLVRNGTDVADWIEGGYHNDTLNGGNGNDNLWSGAGHDVLDGGIGADIMRGKSGNDVYIVDQSDDQVIEDGLDGGLDMVMSSVSFTLPNYVEYLNALGTGAHTLIGNGLNNVIVGTDAHNVLDGSAGADTLNGGGGDDIYHIDNSGDWIIDSSGVDAVVTYIGHTLAPAIEHVTAVGIDSIALSGNVLANVLTGNAGRNSLKGEADRDSLDGGAGFDRLSGGFGNDRLTGGTGRDVFVFEDRLGSSKTDRTVNFDKIADFSVRDDTIWLENAIFRNLVKTGTLKMDFFVIGSRPKDKNDHVLYNKKTGILSYDADGSGQGVAIEFAHLKKGLLLTHKDFFVI